MNAVTPVVTLRPALEADHDAIAGIWHASASLKGVGPAVMPSLADMRSETDEELRSGWRLTAAVRGQSILGFSAIKPNVSVLDQLFVAPGALGCGIGRALLADAMRTMPAGFTLFTRPSNERARRFYAEAGLSMAGNGRHPRTGETIIHYAWRP